MGLRENIFPARLESAHGVIKMLAVFFEDYNENSPHKTLKLKSPREYLRSVRMAIGTFEFSSTPSSAIT
jgi:transposase InsO family protein